MTLLNVASSGRDNGCSGDARQLAGLSVYLPPVQKVTPAARGLPGPWLGGGGLSAGCPGRDDRARSCAGPDPRSELARRGECARRGPRRHAHGPWAAGGGASWRRAAAPGAGLAREGTPAPGRRRHLPSRPAAPRVVAHATCRSGTASRCRRCAAPLLVRW